MDSKYKDSVVITNGKKNSSFFKSTSEKHINYEYIEITNLSNDTISLAGWVLADDKSHHYVFPNFISNRMPLHLRAKEKVIIHTGRGNDSYKVTDSISNRVGGCYMLYQNRNICIFSCKGDEVILIDNENKVVDQKKLKR